MAIKDKPKLLRDLLALGVCFRHRLSEPDLQVYAEIVNKNLDDGAWQHAMNHFTGQWAKTDEAPRFMPTPQELVAVGRRAPSPPPPLTEEQVEYREQYFGTPPVRLRLVGDSRVPRGLLLAMPEPEPLSEAEWEQRRRDLLAQAEGKR